MNAEQYEHALDLFWRSLDSTYYAIREQAYHGDDWQDSEDERLTAEQHDPVTRERANGRARGFPLESGGSAGVTRR